MMDSFLVAAPVLEEVSVVVVNLGDVRQSLDTRPERGREREREREGEGDRQTERER